MNNKTVAFLFTISLLFAMGCIFEDCRILFGLVGLMVLSYAFFVWSWFRDRKRILAVLIALSMIQVPQARSAPLIIGGVCVLIAGGIVGCRAYKRCNRIANARTNAWPEEIFSPAAQPVTTGALFTWEESGVCYEERLIASEPTRCSLFISLDAETNLTTEIVADSGYDVSQDWLSFQAEMSANGLFTSKSASFSIDGHPCEPQQVPITFTNRTITIGSGGVLLSVERSDDLQVWEPVISLNVTPGGLPWRIEDVSFDKQFYRVKMQTDF